MSNLGFGRGAGQDERKGMLEQPDTAAGFLPRSSGQPLRRVAVVGGGIVGLATAWFLQERGVEATVFERDHVGAGSSWGNAGWLAPALTTPLPEPAVLRYGVRAALSPASPVYVPPSLDPSLVRFLAGFVRHSTPRRWKAAMRALRPLNERSLDAFDRLADGGVAAPTHKAEPFLACYRNDRERQTLVEELQHMRAAGHGVQYELLSGSEARELSPTLSANVGTAVLLHGQRFINPPQFVRSLADAVRARGGNLREGVGVHQVSDQRSGVVVSTDRGDHRIDAVVVATGAWLGSLLRPFGVRRPVQAGRGYSFSVPTRSLPAGPLYFPAERVACTPLQDRMRVAGMMEFRRPEARLDPRRIEAIVNAVAPYLDGVDLADRQDEWVGSRPCTPDGLPLIGATTSPRVFAAGGHGMWGVVLGPLTGQLVAESVVTGAAPSELTPLDPLR
jgi:D-amino-acid dehydrogenase